jgi:osmotically-inducible protein OsmY
MFQKPKVPDRMIQQKVTQQLPRRGIRPPSDVHVTVSNGTVTLSGKIEFEMQRKAAHHAASAVNGVHRVVDHLTVMHNTIGGWHAKKPDRRM